MHTLITNEELTSIAFSQQAPVFDNLYGSNAIIDYKRKRVRDHVEKYIQPGSDILELNSGTGEDALYFAAHGHTVHATDVSQGMLDVLKAKVTKYHCQQKITSELCSFTELNLLQNKKKYDYVFSNFAGLNCTDQLATVLDGINGLLKPGGIITLVLLPKFCLWETLLFLKGKFKTATRRFMSRNGRSATVSGKTFKCWYYNPSFIQSHLRESFKNLSLEGLCTFVPPSYIENFAEKHPSKYAFLQKLENRLKAKWPWRVIGDYYILTLKKME